EFPLTEEEIQNSVIEWIYATNKLEFSGAETIVDTKKILRALMKTQSNVEKEVLQTAELLSTTYDRSSGKLRKSDVYASNIDKSLYYFPHHGLIKDHLFSLGKLRYFGRNTFIVYFCPSVFHSISFLGTSPFEDGNGRICRFLSKRILDLILPVPFPMFRDREAYLLAIEDGRKESDPFLAPLPLLKLSLNSAISYYKEFLQTRQKRPPNDNLYDYFIVAGSEEVGIICWITEMWEILRDGSYTDCDFGVIIRVKKPFVTDWISDI
ncbi:hypothetical protein HK099_006946, partial [Clydaea vesicula]